MYGMVPVDDLLEVGPQHDHQLLEGHPLLDVERHLLLVGAVPALLGQRHEDQRALVDQSLAQRVQVLAVLRRDVLWGEGTGPLVNII